MVVEERDVIRDVAVTRQYRNLALKQTRPEHWLRIVGPTGEERLYPKRPACQSIIEVFGVTYSLHPKTPSGQWAPHWRSKDGKKVASATLRYSLWVCGRKREGETAAVAALDAGEAGDERATAKAQETLKVRLLSDLAIEVAGLDRVEPAELVGLWNAAKGKKRRKIEDIAIAGERSVVER